MRINNKKLKNRKKLLLDFVSNKEYQPMRAKDIAMLLQIPKGKRSELFQVLDELEAEGKIICKKGKYEKVRKIATVKTGSPELLEGTLLLIRKDLVLWNWKIRKKICIFPRMILWALFIRIGYR